MLVLIEGFPVSVREVVTKTLLVATLCWLVILGDDVVESVALAKTPETNDEVDPAK
jgi:hypothetical protein